MTPIVHCDRCSNFQVTDDQGKICSHSRVNPKFSFHFQVIESQITSFLGGVALCVHQFNLNSPNMAEIEEIFIFSLFSVYFEDVHGTK